MTYRKNSSVWNRPVNPPDEIHPLAKLLSERRLREEFRRDRLQVIDELNVSAAQAEQLMSISMEQLDAQAESLIAKRYNEVRELAPQTWMRLGEHAVKCFIQYAETSKWPSGHQRHMVDAVRFCEFVRLNCKDCFLQSEYQWLTFRCGKRHFRFCFTFDYMLGDKRKWAIQYFWRDKKQSPNRTAFFMRFRNSDPARQRSSQPNG